MLGQTSLCECVHHRLSLHQLIVRVGIRVESNEWIVVHSPVIVAGEAGRSRGPAGIPPHQVEAVLDLKGERRVADAIGAFAARPTLNPNECPDPTLREL